MQDDQFDSMVLTGKTLERYFELNTLLVEFAQLFAEEGDRGAVIVGAAYIDTLLEYLLIEFLIDDEKSVEELFQHNGPLSSYSSKVNFAYCLGFISKTIRNDLRLLSKIRNRFAHDLTTSFADENIRAWCLSFKWHEECMGMKAPDGATVQDTFHVAVHTLISHLHGLVGVARGEKRKPRLYP